MRESIVNLYPGFLTKGSKGKILWHSRMPSFDQNKNDWPKDEAVDVTACVFDPWPYTAGGQDCILEVSKF
jgi:hypothetical protein